MIQVSALYCYPIKSLGGVPLKEAVVTDRGLLHDRRWMLVDERGQFLSQRKFAQMALLQVSIGENGLLVQHKNNGHSIVIPFQPQTNHMLTVTVWDSTSKAQQVSAEADAWFSEMLQVSCRLVYMPEEQPILVEPEYASGGEVTSFSDGYPFLLIGQASLDYLNSKLEAPVPMNRFRPNIVVSGSQPNAEDFWSAFNIGNMPFFGVKKCGRCVVTTIDQDTGNTGKEPLKTLATYRQEGSKIYFGQNLLHRGTGTIRFGDEVTLLQTSS